jgi:hypothetical protein
VSPLLVALRHEGLTLLRTREAWTMAVLPAALFAPVTLLLISLTLSFDASPRLGVPADHPLELEGFVTVPLADPGAAWAWGEVDAAIVAWELHESPELRLQADALWRTDADRLQLDQGLDAWLDEQLADRLRAAGADPEARAIAHLRRAPPFDPTFMMWSYLLLFASSISCLTLPTRTAAERDDGVIEALATTGTPPWVLLGARAAVSALFTLTVVSAAATPFVLLLREELGLTLRAVDLAEALAALLLWGTACVGIGLRAGSGRAALTLASAAAADRSGPVTAHRPASFGLATLAIPRHEARPPTGIAR